MNYTVVPLLPDHAGAVSRLMKASYDRGEVLYKPLMVQEILRRFFAGGMTGFAALDESSEVLGIIHGCTQLNPLPGEADPPLFLSLLLVAPEARNQGIGQALLEALKKECAAMGCRSLCISGESPLPLSWIIPGTPGHDHNKAPGLWEDGAGAAWFMKHGFKPQFREISLYADLRGWSMSPEIEEKRKKLAEAGIYTGRWAPGMAREFDGMCDRVGSEYWRHVLQTEMAAWDQSTWNRDPSLWADERRPEGPRPMLVAIRENRIVGFTGPVDLQSSGRGWFTGICADPDCGGLGIGSVLFSMLLQEFVDEGAAFCSIYTGSENHAQKIYFRAGLRQTASWAVVSYPLDGDGEWSHRYF